MSATLDNRLDRATDGKTSGVMEFKSCTVNECERIVADLGERGWSVCPGFLDHSRTATLAREVRDLSESDGLRPARIGRGRERNVHAETRGDRIHWLDQGLCTPAQRSVMEDLETLRLAINRVLYLGLFEYDGHLTVYPPGTFYRRHLDRFRDAPQRMVSCILYLNENWRETDGGQLRLFLDAAADGPHIDILPQGGTLVTFLSDRFYHEVLPAARDRLSLTGWFRIRD